VGCGGRPPTEWSQEAALPGLLLLLLLLAWPLLEFDWRRLCAAAAKSSPAECKAATNCVCVRHAAGDK
jgi:hypothetical protein